MYVNDLPSVVSSPIYMFADDTKIFHALISKSFEYLGPIMLNRLFKTLVCPILEYGNAIWGPHFILDQQKIEKFNTELLILSPPSKNYSMQNVFLL